MLLPVPRVVVLEYGRFLATRDRLKYRLEIYEQELTNF